MKKIIIFNGPPRAGKDTASEIICSHIKNAKILKFTEIVKNKTHESLGLFCQHDTYENLKDTPLKEFNGITPRQAYINTSEDLRGKYGERAIANIFVDNYFKIDASLVVNPDIGFQFEADALLDKVSVDSVLFIKLKRNGKTFENDCRDWIEMPGCLTFELNNSTKEQLKDDVLSIVSDFLEK